jgi:hypothetical protein
MSLSANRIHFAGTCFRRSIPRNESGGQRRSSRRAHQSLSAQSAVLILPVGTAQERLCPPYRIRLASCINAAGDQDQIKPWGARQMTGNIDLLDAELKVAQTECDDIDTAIAQIAADDADAKAKFIELSERRKIAGERLSRISTALTEARSGSA